MTRWTTLNSCRMSYIDILQDFSYRFYVDTLNWRIEYFSYYSLILQKLFHCSYCYWIGLRWEIRLEAQFFLIPDRYNQWSTQKYMKCLYSVPNNYTRCIALESLASLYVRPYSIISRLLLHTIQILWSESRSTMQVAILVPDFWKNTSSWILNHVLAWFKFSFYFFMQNTFHC